MANIIIFTLALVVLVFMRVVIQRRTAQLANARPTREKFMRLASDLINEDVYVPDEVAALVHWMAQNVNNPSAFRHLALSMIASKSEAEWAEMQKKHIKMNDLIEKMPAEFKRKFLDLIPLFLAASSYSSVFFGWMWRKAYRAILRPEARPVATVIVYEDAGFYMGNAAFV